MIERTNAEWAEFLRTEYPGEAFDAAWALEQFDDMKLRLAELEKGQPYDVLYQIRAALGVGEKAMLSELPGLVAELKKDRARLEFMIREDLSGGKPLSAETYNFARTDIDAAMEAGK